MNSESMIKFKKNMNKIDINNMVNNNKIANKKSLG